MYRSVAAAAAVVIIIIINQVGYLNSPLYADFCHRAVTLLFFFF